MEKVHIASEILNITIFQLEQKEKLNLMLMYIFVYLNLIEVILLKFGVTVFGEVTLVTGICTQVSEQILVLASRW